MPHLSPKRTTLADAAARVVVADGTTVERQPADPGSGRDVAIDRLRGLCLLSMTFGHLTVSGPTRSAVNVGLHAPGWVSGASGFVFLSGVSVGLLWRSKGMSGPDVKRWTITRAVMLLLVHLALNMAAIAWSDLVHPTWWVPASRPSLIQLLVGSWMIPFGDVLPMYVVFLVIAVIIAPWVACAPRLVVMGAVGVYLAGLLLPAVGPMRTPGNVVWDLFTWQLIFVTGLVGGTRWSAVRRLVERHERTVMITGLAAVGAIVALRVAFALFERGSIFVDSPMWREGFETRWLDKTSMPPFRLLLVFTLGPAVYRLCTYRLPFDRFLHRAGSRSLRVYAISTLACLVPPLLGPIDSVATNDLLVSVLTAAVLATGGWPTLWRGRPWSI